MTSCTATVVFVVALVWVQTACSLPTQDMPTSHNTGSTSHPATRDTHSNNMIIAAYIIPKGVNWSSGPLQNVYDLRADPGTKVVVPNPTQAPSTPPPPTVTAVRAIPGTDLYLFDVFESRPSPRSRQADSGNGGMITDRKEHSLVSHLEAAGVEIVSTLDTNHIIARAASDQITLLDDIAYGYSRTRLAYLPKLSASVPNLHWIHNATLLERSTRRMAWKQRLIDAMKGQLMRDRINQLSGRDGINVDGVKRTTPTRYALAPDNQVAGQFIAEMFSQMGYQTSTQVFDIGKNKKGRNKGRNIIAIKQGSDSSKRDEIIVVGSHYDDISEKKYRSTRAPGAIDDASGTAALLTLAAACQEFDFQRTIYFIAFSGEEQGMFGSEYFVRQARSQGLNIMSALLMDMTGFSGKKYGLKIEGEPEYEPLMFALRDNAKKWSPKLKVGLAYESSDSDHVSFQTAGIPAVLAIELDDVDYPYYHTIQDDVGQLNQAQERDIARAVAGTVFDLALGSLKEAPV